ncbi:MAG: hypothetical protein PHR37_01630 [Eubacteriales bacterium]|nr:hypothetical protein [Eubacteriales bacterium]
MFCNCVFDTSEGMRALEHPEDFDFPNEEQPEYEGPLVQQSRARTVAPLPAQVPQSRKKEKPFEPKIKELPALKIPSRMKMIIIVAVVVVLGILAAILFPTIATRSDRHEKISAGFLQELADENLDSESINVQNLNSDYVILILDEKPTEEEAVILFNQYCEVRAEVMELDRSSFEDTHTAVTMRIASTEGGIEISEPESESAIGDEALRILP